MRRRADQIARVWAIAAFVCWVTLAAVVVGHGSSGTANAVSLGGGEVTPMVTGEGGGSKDGAGLEQRRSEPQTTVEQVSSSVMCPSCDTTLDQSNSPAAERMRAWVEEAVAAGWTEEEIRDGLVAEYDGDESILATPRAKGLGLLVWVVPAIVALTAAIGGFVILRRWRRSPARAEGEDDQTRSGSSS